MTCTLEQITLAVTHCQAGKNIDENFRTIFDCYYGMADREVERLLEQLRLLQAQIRAASPRYAALTQPQPLNLKQIQGHLDSDTLPTAEFMKHFYTGMIVPHQSRLATNEQTSQGRRDHYHRGA